MSVTHFLWKRRSGSIALALLAGVASGVGYAALIALVQAGIQASVSLKWTILGFILLCILAPATKMACQVLMLRFAHAALRHLITETARNILGAPLRTLEEIGSARLMGALMDDVGVISAGMMASFTLVLNSAVMLGCLVVLGFASGWAVVVMLILTGFTLATYNWISRALAARVLREGQAVRNVLFSHFHGLTMGIKELKLNRTRRRAFIANDLEPTARRFEQLDMSANIVYFGAGAWSDVLLFAVLGLIVFVLPSLNLLDRADTASVALVLLYLMSPLAAIATVFPRIERASVVLQDLKSLGLELAASAEPETNGEPLEKIWTHLRLRDLTFSYEQDQAAFVLGPLNLTFERGQLIFIMGGNGTGKTTIAKLLSGLYVPAKGALQLGGQDIDESNREHFRNLFSVIFPDFFLFDRVGGDLAPESDQKANDLLSQLLPNHGVRVKDGKFTTTQLSQGQRKRLALISAYLEDRPMLILDEWAADQQPSFRDFFYLSFLPELKARGKTVFVITHDDRYQHVADRVLAVQDGGIVEPLTESADGWKVTCCP